MKELAEHRPRRRIRLLAATLGVILGYLIATAVHKSAEEQRYLRLFRIGYFLTDPSNAYRPALAEEFQLPPSVMSKDDAIRYLLVTAAHGNSERFGSGWYVLARYFAESDCAEATKYLAIYLDTKEGKGNPEARRLSESWKGGICSL